MENNETTKPEPSIGEKRVRVDFNVNKDEKVDEIKKKYAELINLIDGLKGDGSQVLSAEKGRLISIAMTETESAAMWAVKAATC